MERLQKVIAQAGIASRRKAEQLILDGKVTVNDKVVRELGTKVTGKEKIEVVLAKLDENLVSEVETFATSKMLEAIQIKDIESLLDDYNLIFN